MSKPLTDHELVMLSRIYSGDGLAPTCGLPDRAAAEIRDLCAVNASLEATVELLTEAREEECKQCINYEEDLRTRLDEISELKEENALLRQEVKDLDCNDWERPPRRD